MLRQNKPYIFPVNVTCQNCIAPIEDNINDLKSHLNIISVSVDLDTKKTIIYVEDDRFSREEINKKLKITLDDIGMLGEEKDEASLTLENPEAKPINSHRKKKTNWHWIMGGIGLLTGVGLLALTLSGIGIPLFAMYLMAAGSSLLTLFIGATTFYEAGKKLIKAKTLTMDMLFSISALIAIGVSIGSFFFPILPMMCNAGLLMLGFRHIGKAIEESLKKKVNANLDFFSRLKPTYICKDKPTPFELIQPDDILQVQRGDVIPVDGICLDDHAYVIKSIEDGILLPRFLAKNQPVYAGMRVAETHPNELIRIKVSKNVHESRLGKLNAELQQARQEKAPIVTAAQKALKWFIPIVLGLALLASIIVGICFPPALAIPIAIKCGIAILVSACPCTLGMITPMAIKLGIKKAQDRGVIFQSGKKLQTAEQTNTVVFDLNGTLTTCKPAVTSFNLLNKSINRKKLLSYVHALEANSSHPIATAISEFSKKYRSTKKCVSTLDDDIKYNGLRATITDTSSTLHGRKLTIGNVQMLNDLGISVSDHLSHDSSAQHIIFVALDNEVVGRLLLKDPLRQDAKHTIDELRRMGKEVHICTGADEHTAYQYADELQIPREKVAFDRCSASNKPGTATKLQYLESLQRTGKKVAMVGDAENDANAVEQADLGIAMQTSDDLTSNLAGANILSDSLTPIVAAFEVANQTVANIKQNLIFSLSYNVIALLAPIAIATIVCCLVAPPVALAILAIALSPAIGAGLMILQSSLVMGNAFRFKKQALPHVDAAEAAVNRDMPTTTVRLLNDMPASEATSAPSVPASRLEEGCDTYNPDSASEASADYTSFPLPGVRQS